MATLGRAGVNQQLVNLTGYIVAKKRLYLACRLGADCLFEAKLQLSGPAEPQQRANQGQFLPELVLRENNYETPL